MPLIERHLGRRRRAPEFFHYAPTLAMDDMTCKLCGYVPNRFVDNPAKCLGDHTRRVHRETWIRTRKRVYYIEEEP